MALWRLKFSTRYVVVRVGGARMLFPLGWSVEFDTTELDVINLLVRLDILKSGATVLDIGGNVGVFALNAARVAGRVITFEPNPRTASLLRYNAGLNPGLSPKITIREQAIGPKEGEVELYLTHGQLGHSLYLHHAVTWGYSGRTVKVRAQTLQQAVADLGLGVVDLLHIDAESVELELVEQSMGLFESGNVRSFAVEFHDIETGKKIASLLQSRGFRTIILESITYCIGFLP
jgi:FkbM family methyltransferase